MSLPYNITKFKEIDTQITDIANKQGDITQLNTTDKSSVVNALKEVKAQANTNASAITNIGNSSPKGVYATLVELQTAYPTGTTGIYVVTADGQWYYWNGSTWVAGGTYQSTVIADQSVTIPKTDFIIHGKNYFDKSSVVKGYTIAYNKGTAQADTASFYSDYIRVASNTTYCLNQNFVHVTFYDLNKTFKSGFLVDSTTHYFTVPADCIYVILSCGLIKLYTLQMELGSVTTAFEDFRREISKLKIDDSNILRKVAPYPYYTTAYIFDKKLYANDSGGPITAKYVGVDLGTGIVPSAIKAKVIFTPGEGVKTAATLISNINGLSQIVDITNGSIHVIFTPISATATIYINRTAYDIKVVNYSTPCVCDGTTEYDIGWSVSENTLTIITPDGVQTQVTDNRISTYLGRYCTFEFYWEKSLSPRQVFNYFEIDVNGNAVLTDNFDRADGNIGSATTGQSYTQIHENL